METRVLVNADTVSGEVLIVIEGHSQWVGFSPDAAHTIARDIAQAADAVATARGQDSVAPEATAQINTQ